MYFFIFFCILLHWWNDPTRDTSWDLHIFSIKRHGLTQPSCLCHSIGLCSVIYYVLCEDKSPLVLFVTSAIFDWGGGWWKKKLASGPYRYSLQKLPSSTQIVIKYVFFFFFFLILLRGCFPFSANVKINRCNKGAKKDTR